MARKSRKVYQRRRIICSVLMLLLLTSILIYTVSCTKSAFKTGGSLMEPIAAKPVYENQPGDVSLAETQIQVTKPAASPEQPPPREYPAQAAGIVAFDAALIESEYAVLLDVTNNTVIASRNSDTRIYPASLTKIMTLLVACEKITDTEQTFTMTYDIIAPLVNQDATRAGFSEGEAVKLIDLLYGAALPSGADATIGLAQAISGSEEAFVGLMNQKAQELGLKDTHFVNTSGLHDPDHYTTATDMAVILEFAIQNELCRKILAAYQYTTSPTPQHPQGILLESTMFSRMYGNEAENVVIEGGKTGYTNESGHCLASFATKNGNTYIAATFKGTGRYMPIYDAIDIYANYLP